MRIELDHLFICTTPGAPEAEKFVEFGLIEAPPNQHPGQGTSCRRFAFVNAMIELFWVSDPSEAQNRSTMRTLLWERWAGRDRNSSLFGICLRPTNRKKSENRLFQLGNTDRLICRIHSSCLLVRRELKNRCGYI